MEAHMVLSVVLEAQIIGYPVLRTNPTDFQQQNLDLLSHPP